MAKKIKFGDFLKGNKDTECETVQEMIDRGVDVRAAPPNSGLFNTPVCRVPFTYNQPRGASVLSNQGAYIVFGQVPASGIAGSYGARGIPADSIDLVVGHHSSSNRGKGPKAKSALDNNFATDAARIYISRLCDIDLALGLASGPWDGPSGRGMIARSGVGIKADGVRIVGREGVRIVTGKMRDAKFGLSGETNSLGGKIGNSAKIQLIAGNDVSGLQGVARGENTRDCLKELTDIIGEIWSACFNLGITQAGLEGVLGVTPIPWHASAMPVSMQQKFTGVLASLYQTRTTLQFWNLNYLKAAEENYIVSRNVMTN